MQIARGERERERERERGEESTLNTFFYKFPVKSTSPLSYIHIRVFPMQKYIHPPSKRRFKNRFPSSSHTYKRIHNTQTRDTSRLKYPVESTCKYIREPFICIGDTLLSISFSLSLGRRMRKSRARDAEGETRNGRFFLTSELN